MKIVTMMAALGLAVAVVPLGAAAEARPYRGDHRAWNYDRGWDHGRGWHDGRRYGPGWGRGHAYGRIHHRCWTEWRYHHRVRVCR